MSQRRLAAIMFTDIVGYTALMGSDEDRAFEVLRKNREIHTKLIEQFNGTLIKEMGDGMLVSFNLVSDAVRCAIEIQKACKEQAIPLKIGIHEGEMVFEGSDVLGDGVNIASRLQESADEGCIFISGPVYGDIKNKSDIRSHFIREKTFKNVDEPVKVYMVSREEGQERESSPIHDRWKSIVALPLIKIGTLVISVSVVAVVIIFLFYRAKSIPFTERDWIVIADFDNLTDETIFDNSLNTAFALSINQSRYVNVFTRHRVFETLKRMNRGGLVKVDEETGREIAMREGVKVCIVPGISRVGSQYILTAKIQEAKTGVIFKSEILYAKSQDEIIDKLDQLSKNVRRHLGETRYEIFEQSKPLSQVTTSSLDALKQYSIGIENHWNMEFEEAITHYENAISIDSNFTSAKASLGNLLFQKFDKERGKEWLDQAILSVDNLTDREKYGILEFYAVNIENNLKKGIEYVKTRIELYPDDPAAHNNLGWNYQNLGYYEKAVEEYKEVLRINPYLMLTYSGVIYAYLGYLGQIDSAKTWSNRMIRYGPDNPWGYFNLGSVYVGIDSLEKAEAAYLKARDLNPNLLINLYRLAHLYRLRGKYDKAIVVFEEILRLHPDESPARYNLGLNYSLLGESNIARSHFIKYKKITEQWLVDYPANPTTYIANGLVLARLGEKDAGWEIGKKALELDSTIHFHFAQLLAALDRKNEALDQLEKALENGYRDLPWIKLYPDLQSLQGEERYQDLLEEYFGY